VLEVDWRKQKVAEDNLKKKPSKNMSKKERDDAMKTVRNVYRNLERKLNLMYSLLEDNIPYEDKLPKDSIFRAHYVNKKRNEEIGDVTDTRNRNDKASLMTIRHSIVEKDLELFGEAYFKRHNRMSTLDVNGW